MNSFAPFTDASLNPKLHRGVGACLVVPAAFFEQPAENIEAIAVAELVRIKRFEENLFRSPLKSVQPFGPLESTAPGCMLPARHSCACIATRSAFAVFREEGLRWKLKDIFPRDQAIRSKMHRCIAPFTSSMISWGLRLSRWQAIPEPKTSTRFTAYFHT